MMEKTFPKDEFMDMVVMTRDLLGLPASKIAAANVDSNAFDFVEKLPDGREHYLALADNTFLKVRHTPVGMSQVVLLSKSLEELSIRRWQKVLKDKYPQYFIVNSSIIPQEFAESKVEPVEDFADRFIMTPAGKMVRVTHSGIVAGIHIGDVVMNNKDPKNPLYRQRLNVRATDGQDLWGNLAGSEEYFKLENLADLEIVERGEWFSLLSSGEDFSRAFETTFGSEIKKNWFFSIALGADESFYVNMNSTEGVGALSEDKLPENLRFSDKISVHHLPYILAGKKIQPFANSGQWYLLVYKDEARQSRITAGIDAWKSLDNQFQRNGREWNWTEYTKDGKRFIDMLTTGRTANKSEVSYPKIQSGTRVYVGHSSIILYARLMGETVLDLNANGQYVLEVLPRDLTNLAVVQDHALLDKDLPGRDPEQFLDEVFDWIEQNTQWTRRHGWNWNIDGRWVNMRVGISTETLPERFIDEYKKERRKLYEDKSNTDIKKLKERLAGKRIKSLNINGRWYLQIIE